MKRSNLLLYFSISCISLLGCAGKYSGQVNFDPSDPLRVAILPFAQVDGKGAIIVPDENDMLVDEVTLISSKLKRTPAQYVQERVAHYLKQTGLDLISPSHVASTLVHSGLGSKDSNRYDLNSIFNQDRKKLCELLTCDALLYGKISEWDRSYYGIQSVTSVAIDLKLISASDGTVLFSTNAADSDSRGLSKVPTGFSDLVIEPLKGLSNEIILALADRVVERSLQPLYVEKRPEFLESSPPAIFASAHDAHAGRVFRDDYLTVLVYGTKGQQGYFSIGEQILNIPLVEKDGGHYIGEYYPLPSDSFEDQPVYVYLSDKFGKTSRQKIGTSPVSLATRGS